MTVDMYNQSAFLVIKIAYMYYIENYSQNEIAKALQISVTTVSRMLKKAKQERIVEFVIRDPYVECISLEKELKETFGLKDVIIAPGLAVEAEDGNYLGDEESAKKLVALEGARYLQRIIKKNDVLGITWGSTIYRLINYLNPAQKVDATFVTLHGSIACCRNELDVRTLVLRMAKAFSGMHYYLLTEALMSSKKAADIIKQEKNNKKVFQMFDNSKTVRGMINLIGIQSPGLSSVPAIANMVEDLVREVGDDLNFNIKDDYNPKRPKPVILRELPYEERAKFIAENPDYGTIICRCETVSKGEILDAIRRPIPATNLDAIKRRVRAGMGRCQGGFCGPRVVGILEKELGISPLEVTKRGKSSYILSMRAKELALQEGGSSDEKVIL